MYATRDGTAKAGEDYTATRGTLAFAAGETERTVEVPILDDALDEGEVTTGILGADAEWDGLLAGVAVSVSEGEGMFDQPGVDSGNLDATRGEPANDNGAGAGASAEHGIMLRAAIRW